MLPSGNGRLMTTLPPEAKPSRISLKLAVKRRPCFTITLSDDTSATDLAWKLVLASCQKFVAAPTVCSAEKPNATTQTKEEFHFINLSYRHFKKYLFTARV